MAAQTGSLHLIIDTISANHSIQPYLNLIKTSGVVCLVGIPPDPVELHAFELMGKRAIFTASGIGG